MTLALTLGMTRQRRRSLGLGARAEKMSGDPLVADALTRPERHAGPLRYSTEFRISALDADDALHP